jgi:hypothetical protein
MTDFLGDGRREFRCLGCCPRGSPVDSQRQQPLGQDYY